MKNKKYEKYMKYAIKQAKLALKINEIPVGAVIVQNENILSVGFNKKEKTRNVLAHAEIVAIYSACKKLKSWRILNSTIYVTLEPCIMCAGAIVSSRIKKVVFGTKRYGMCLSNTKILNEIYSENKIEIVSGIFSKECEDMLKYFFKTLRKK